MTTATTPQGTQLTRLTERQASFLALADEGKTHREIAAALGVSTGTVYSVLYFMRNRDLFARAGERVLTARQLEILCLAGAGLHNGQIAAELYLSRYTIENQLKLARGRLGARNTAHCIMLAISLELLILDHDGQLLVPHAHRLAA